MKVKNVVIFCGANANKKYLTLAYDVGKALAENGFTTITGGGPGMMEQVNKGAFEAKGESHGIHISKEEEKPKEIFTYSEMYNTFDKRHKRLISLGDAFIVLPGGLGTILEAVDITQLKKFNEIPMNAPLIFVSNYFNRLTNVFEEIDKEGFINEPLHELYSYAETPAEMIKILL